MCGYHLSSAVDLCRVFCQLRGVFVIVLDYVRSDGRTDVSSKMDLIFLFGYFVSFSLPVQQICRLLVHQFHALLSMSNGRLVAGLLCFLQRKLLG